MRNYAFVLRRKTARGRLSLYTRRVRMGAPLVCTGVFPQVPKRSQNYEL